jgi:hypothetical protein
MTTAATKPLEWPAGLRETPARLWWFQHYAALPPRLPLAEIANRLGINYSLARYYVTMFNYELGDPVAKSERRPRRKRPAE